MKIQIRRAGRVEEKEAYAKALEWFFSFPSRELTLSDLSLELKISKTTANNIVRQLSDEGFLKKETLGRTWRIAYNQNQPNFIARKIGYNIIKIYESGILGEIHKRIPNPKAVILFGSYRKGDDVENSDIDLAVETADDKEPRILKLGNVRQIGYRKNVPVNIFIFSRKKIDLNVFANIANGIVLEGFLEVRP